MKIFIAGFRATVFTTHFATWGYFLVRRDKKVTKETRFRRILFLPMLNPGASTLLQLRDGERQVLIFGKLFIGNHHQAK
jgi:hypothetical protein